MLFVMELPSYHMPTVGAILRSMWLLVSIKKAVPSSSSFIVVWSAPSSEKAGSP